MRRFRIEQHVDVLVVGQGGKDLPAHAEGWTVVVFFLGGVGKRQCQIA